MRFKNAILPNILVGSFIKAFLSGGYFCVRVRAHTRLFIFLTSFPSTHLSGRPKLSLPAAAAAATTTTDEQRTNEPTLYLPSRLFANLFLHIGPGLSWCNDVV